VEYDLDQVRRMWQAEPLETRSPTLWRYRELLPISARQIPADWDVGWTPLINAPRLAASLGVRRVLLKDDSRNPTASFKDRASSVGVVHARQLGARTIACASTGNAAASLAGLAARAGMPAVIFVPCTAPEPKLAQLLVFGATVVAVNGPYDAAYQLCSAACERFDWYNRNCAINPVLVEGKKTCGLELSEQCQDRVPAWVAVSIGDGCTIAGIWKGFEQMRALGRIDRLPRMLGVQGAGVAPVEYAWRHDHLPPTAQSQGCTVADSIDVSVPRNWRKAVKAVRDSRGHILCVTDDQILAAMRQLGRQGVCAEPAAAAAVAGLGAAVQQGLVGADEDVLAVITGSGLKDTRAALRAGGEPLRSDPCLEDLERVLGAVGKPTGSNEH
jgi:threonine synthase